MGVRVECPTCLYETEVGLNMTIPYNTGELVQCHCGNKFVVMVAIVEWDQYLLEEDDEIQEV